MTVYGFPYRFSRRRKPFTVGDDYHVIRLPRNPNNPGIISKPLCAMSPGELAEAKLKNFSFLRPFSFFSGKVLRDKFKDAPKTSYINLHVMMYSCEFCQVDFMSVPSSYHLVHFESYRGIPLCGNCARHVKKSPLKDHLLISRHDIDKMIAVKKLLVE